MATIHPPPGMLADTPGSSTSSLTPGSSSHLPTQDPPSSLHPIPSIPSNTSSPSFSAISRPNDIEPPSTLLPSYYPDSRNHDLEVLSSKSSYHTPAARNLLDGVHLAMPIRAPRPAPSTPTFDLSHDTYLHSLPKLTQPWVPKRHGGWVEDLLRESGSGSAGDGSSRSNINRNGTRAQSHASQPPRSSLPPDSPSDSRSNNPTLATTNHGDKFPTNFPIPPIPPRGYSGSAIPELTPISLSYPGMMFGNVSIPKSSMNMPIRRPEDQFKVSGEDFAQALSIYKHLLSAVPHIRPVATAAPSPPGQEFDSLLKLAEQGALIVKNDSAAQSSSGQTTATTATMTSSASPTILPNSRNTANEGKSKPAPKCLGCGATETPEWRRGPLGPRTLCNACGLVHMKLQRKKKKLEEKAAMAAAAEAAKR